MKIFITFGLPLILILFLTGCGDIPKRICSIEEPKTFTIDQVIISLEPVTGNITISPHIHDSISRAFLVSITNNSTEAISLNSYFSNYFKTDSGKSHNATNQVYLKEYVYYQGTDNLFVDFLFSALCGYDVTRRTHPEGWISAPESILLQFDTINPGQSVKGFLFFSMDYNSVSTFTIVIPSVTISGKKHSLMWKGTLSGKGEPVDVVSSPEEPSENNTVNEPSQEEK